MGFYDQYILPSLIHKAMADKRLDEYRADALRPCCGNVLEVGVGGGANLRHYGRNVKTVVGIDNHSKMEAYCLAAPKREGLNFKFILSNAESLSFESQAFDFVVSTFTLCSIESPDLTLSEIKRVLKPGGRFIILEHGKCLKRWPSIFQSMLNPLQQKIAGGCHLNREIATLVANAGFNLEESRNFKIPFLPLTHGYIYQGICAR